ncbi:MULTISPECIES: M48 family metallopeptidase [Methylocystis]|uniref:M48 family metallopeptidase n=1 Tax=Methylocystis TaxID=133 RepID=UPI001923154F|nr:MULTISPECIES: SprT family zinc-dependent metalloprotease [Methylocystis]MBL1257399.1 M48 family metallopeptidase [Methylocystis sp. Sn-Cys]MDJ0448980.1 SprT family zinc-dependent metalloprotease [Methylocystis sp. JR02]
MLRLLRDGPSGKGTSLLTLEHAGETIVVALRRATTARRFTLRVRFAARDAVLTMPSRASIREARAFAQRHAAWIATRLNRLPETIPFAHGSLIPLRGVDHAVIHLPDRRGTVWTEERDDVETPLALCVAGQAEHVHRRVQDHFKREARRDLEDAVARHTSALSLPPRGVGLRDPVSRWGSCSSTGSLNFSWRLIMAPPFVLDYLAAHEVAHLVHLDHSPRFWSLARRLCPETDRAEAWLSAHGAHLHKYGAKG